MKQYNVYGMGNALVHRDFELSEETLQRLDIEKGVATLIDLRQVQQLRQDLEGIHHTKACGGMVANTVQRIQQLGGRCFYNCNLAQDEDGDFFLEDIHYCGVNTNLLQANRDEGVTGQSIALITPDAERTTSTFWGVATHLTRDVVDESALRQAEILYLEGFLVSSPQSLDTMIYAKQKACRVWC